MFNIPSGVFEGYREVVTELITNTQTGEICKIVYPPKKVPCECVGTGGNTTSSYLDGSPNIFGNSCALCGGTNYKEVSSTETVNVNVYTPSDRGGKSAWSKLTKIQVPDADLLIRGQVKDMDKVQRMAYIEVFSEFNKYGTQRYTLADQPYLHGFGNHFFIAFLRSA